MATETLLPLTQFISQSHTLFSPPLGVRSQITLHYLRIKGMLSVAPRYCLYLDILSTRATDEVETRHILE